MALGLLQGGLPKISLENKQVSTHIHLTASPDFTGLSFTNDTARIRLDAVVDKSGPSLSTRGGQGTARPEIHFFTSEEGFPVAWLKDKEQKLRLVLRESKSETFITIYDNNNKLRSWMHLAIGGVPDFSWSDSRQRFRFRLMEDGSGQPMMRLLSPDDHQMRTLK